MMVRFLLPWLVMSLLTVLSFATSTAIAGGHESRLKALYKLQKPEGSGPFPVVVLVPGCSGFKQRSYENVEAKLVRMGFATVRVDYTGARYLDSCWRRVTMDEVADDIFRILKNVTGTGFIKASSVNLLGWSYGGGVLHLLSKLDEHPDVRVAAVAAYYPTCSEIAPWSTPVPVLMLLGAADNMAPPVSCRKLVRASDSAVQVIIEEYENAYHGFDNEDLPTKKQYASGAVGHHPAAAEKAWQALAGFLVR